MAVEENMEIDVTSRKLVKRTRQIVIDTPRDISKYFCSGSREHFIIENETVEYPKPGRTVNRLLAPRFMETITINTLGESKTLKVIEIADAISKLFDRWAAEDEAAENTPLPNPEVPPES